MTETPRLKTNPLEWIGEPAPTPTREKPAPASPRTPARAGKAATRAREATKTTEAGLPSGWTRATFLVRKEHVEKLKGVSFFEDRTLKELMDEALAAYLKGRKVPTRGGK